MIRLTHCYVRHNKLTINGSDNGLSPGRCQAIIWTNAEILLIRPSATNFSDFFYRNSSIFIEENTFKNIVCDMLSNSSRLGYVTCQSTWCRGSNIPRERSQYLGAISLSLLTIIVIPIMKLRWSEDRLIFVMGIPIPGKTVYILRQGPGCYVLSVCWQYEQVHMMTSSIESIFRVTGHLCGEFTGHRWRGALIISLICAWITRWVNNRLR